MLCMQWSGAEYVDSWLPVFRRLLRFEGVQWKFVYQN